MTSPELEIDGVVLEVVEKMKLLGVMLTSDLKWRENTEFITKKAYKRLWLIKRLKQLGASTASLVDMYTKHVRSVVEFFGSSVEFLSHPRRHLFHRKSTKMCFCSDIRIKIL